jgi:integrase
MGRKRTGSVSRNPDGTFTVSITTNDGKRPKKKLPVYINGKSVSRAVAEKVASECQTLYDRGFPVPLFGLNQEKPKETPTVLEYAKKNHQTRANLSRRDVGVIIKYYIEPTQLSKIQMGKVTKADIRNWADELLTKKPQNNNHDHLSPKYLHRIYQVLSYLFKLGALFDDYYNPCAELTPEHLGFPDPIARVHDTDKKYSKADVVAFLTSPKLTADRRVLYALYLFTGLRTNEVPALRFSNYDPQQKPLGRIIAARAMRGGKRASTKTKTTHMIPVHPEFAPILSAWWETGFEAFIGRKPTTDDFIVPDEKGSPRKYSRIYTMFKRDCERLGVDAKRLYDTRSTFISTAMDDGADKDALKRVTHSAPKADAFDLYDQAAWHRVCKAVSMLRYDLPREQKAGENALNNALLRRRTARKLVSKGAESEQAVSQIYSKESASDAIRSYLAVLPFGLAPITTESDKQPQDNAPSRAIEIPLGLMTGEALAYSFLEIAELSGEVSL